MKFRKLMMLAMMIVVAACKDTHRGATSSSVLTLTTTTAMIPVDSANKMIGSYLNSTGYPNDTILRSVTIDASTLRMLLDSMQASDSVIGIKISLAHTLNYINSGKANQPAGYRSGALTFILSGFNASGDYINLPGGLVIDNGMPCPTNCPPGSAAGPFFPLSIQ